MKNIAVIVHGLTVEYPMSILEGIISYFEGRKDVRLIIAPVRFPGDYIGVYEYQFGSTAQLLCSKEIDGIIVISGSYSTQNNRSITDFLKIYSDKPMVSIGMDLNMENVAYTCGECKTSYLNIVSHLNKKHGCKKIAFMTAKLTGSEESEERYNAFCNALNQCGLTFDEENLFHARFTGNSAIEALSQKIHSKEDVKFDAIVAANDLMAIGCMTYLQSLGLQIPQDVKVVGFDNTSHAHFSKPTLSTIDQTIFRHGYEGAKLCDDMVHGRTTPKKNVISSEPVYRQSCGCVPLNEFRDVSANEDGKLCEKEDTGARYIKANGQNFSFFSCINEINVVLDMVKSADTFRQFFYAYKYIMQAANLDTSLVCFYKKTQTFLKDNEIKIPSTIKVSMVMDKNKNLEIFEPGKTFNYKNKLMLNEYFPETSGIFILYPIYSGLQNYGYVINKIQNIPISVYSTTLKIINSGLCQSYEYTDKIYENIKLTDKNEELMKNNKSLDKQSKTDVLTKLMNRRGFLEVGQSTIQLAIATHETGLVFFGDLDGLKKINDTYGHEMGDTAIKLQAEVFRETFRSNDIIARLGGDEFAVITVGMGMEKLNSIRNRILEISRIKTIKNNLPFELSCSIGAIAFSPEMKNLSDLLQDADKLLYEEKERKKCRSAVK